MILKQGKNGTPVVTNFDSLTEKAWNVKEKCNLFSGSLLFLEIYKRVP